MAEKKRLNSQKLPDKALQKYRVQKKTTLFFDDLKVEEYELIVEALIKAMDSTQKKYYSQNLPLKQIKQLSLFSIIRSKLFQKPTWKTTTLFHSDKEETDN